MKAMATHTVACYRNSTKCRLCGMIIQKDKKKEHINRFRDIKKLVQLIKEDNEEEVSLYFDHELDVNLEIKEEMQEIQPLQTGLRCILPPKQVR